MVRIQGFLSINQIAKDVVYESYPYINKRRNNISMILLALFVL